jgi:putative PIN family toxin of toxin-antitoxin system
MVFVQAVLSDHGPAARAFAMAESHAIELIVSAAVLNEVADVLERPRLRAKSPRLTFQRIDQFLDRLRRVATWIQEVPEAIRLGRDPKDKIYLNLAVAADAEFIVTRIASCLI